jgi:hypothetical protein
MISTDRFPILNAVAWQAARRFNSDPLAIEDCYDYILAHVLPKVSDSDNHAFLRMKCQSEAHNWYASEQRHTSRTNHAVDPDELCKRQGEQTPEEQVIEHQDMALMQNLFRLVGLTRLEQRVIETRMGGFVTLHDVAALEGLTRSSAGCASARARAKLLPAIMELAAEYRYDTSQQANTRKGNRTRSGSRGVDQYHPRREMKP